MRLFGLASVFVLVSAIASAEDTESLRQFFSQLSRLEFEKAKEAASFEKDKKLRAEMVRLADILSEGGTEKRDADLPLFDEKSSNMILTTLRRLQRGYVSLYYDETKGQAYREFYAAYQGAKRAENQVLVKACLYSILEYHRAEIAQNSDAYSPYLNELESLSSEPIDQVHLIIYKAVFDSKSAEPVDGNYFALAEGLDQAERILEPESPVLAYVFYERALIFELLRNPDQAAAYYRRTVDQARDHRFLWYIRFASYIKLMMNAAKQNQLKDARALFGKAKSEARLADTLRTNYYLNLYSAELMNALHKSDSAFYFLRKAHGQGYQLDFRENTLEINRLNVELDTQAKENANLQLTQQKNWLVSGIAGLGLLAVVGYLVYRNRLAKSSLQIQEKEMHSMKLEKQLKDQEITGIDQMIEAQEKERQRIANELHDHLGSHLASIKLYFQNLQQKANDPAQEELFQKTDQLLEETYQQVRTLAHARNIGVNSKDGLMPAVKTFAARISASNSLTVDVEEHGMDTRLENSLEILLFRIVQELTTNVIKHARASEVTISLTRHEDSINLMVEDNGAGFDASQIKPRDTMGLHSIQKRVENLGGTVTVDSILNSGTTVIVDLPI